MGIDWYLFFSVMVAWFLDLLIGDPLWMPHPVVMFGNCIAWCEKIFNKNRFRFWKGLFLSVVLIVATWLTFHLLMWASKQIHMAFFYILNAGFVFVGLANRTLIKEGYEVFRKLEWQGIDAGRKQLSRIVGRDTSQLTAQQVRMAVLETMSENLSDGVVAPLFWYALGGVPAMMAYKMINTLDSMIGYRSDRFRWFGCAAARIDDIANYIPARITALLMVLISFSRRGAAFSIRFGHCHKSPNSGFPEAALAGILNVRLGGPNTYGGRWVQKPYIGLNDRTIDLMDLKKTIFINHMVCFISVWWSAVIASVLF